MKKIDNRGYAITVIIFSILIVFIIILSSLLITMNNSVKLNKTVKEDVIENIQLSSKTTGMTLTKRLELLENKLASINGDNIIDTIYPIGSIYISTVDQTVEDVIKRFPNTKWEQYAQGRTLVGVGSTTDANNNALVYSAGELSEDGVTYKGQTGGSVLTTLNTSNLPSHNHTYTPSGSVSSKFVGSSVTSGNNNTNPTATFTGSSSTTTSGQGAHTHTTTAKTITNPLVVSGATLYWRSATKNTGSGGSISANYISGDESIKITIPALSIASSGAHTHTVTPKGSVSLSGTHTHSVTANGTVTSTFTGNEKTTELAGSDSPSSFSVQDPYITVYMYKRTE